MRKLASFFMLIAVLFTTNVFAQQMQLLYPVNVSAGFSIGSGTHNQLQPEFSTPAAAFQEASIVLDGGVYAQVLNVISLDEEESAEFGGGNKTHFYAGFKRTVHGLDVNTRIAAQKIWNPETGAGNAGSRTGSLVYVGFPSIGNYKPYAYAGTDILQNVFGLSDPELITSGAGIKILTPIVADVSVFGYQEDGNTRRFFRALAEINNEFLYGDRTFKLSLEGGVDRELGNKSEVVNEDYEFLVSARLITTL